MNSHNKAEKIPGLMPWSLNGISSWLTIRPQTPFLTMPRGELVTKLGSSGLTNQDLDQGLVVFGVTYHNLVDISSNG